VVRGQGQVHVEKAQHQPRAQRRNNDEVLENVEPGIRFKERHERKALTKTVVMLTKEASWLLANQDASFVSMTKLIYELATAFAARALPKSRMRSMN
jgi:hypothetical protein